MFSNDHLGRSSKYTKLWPIANLPIHWSICRCPYRFSHPISNLHLCHCSQHKKYANFAAGDTTIPIKVLRYNIYIWNVLFSISYLFLNWCALPKYIYRYSRKCPISLDSLYLPSMPPNFFFQFPLYSLRGVASSSN
jgi:hypothetical protein